MNTEHTPANLEHNRSLDPTVTAVHDPVPAEASHTVFAPSAVASPSPSGWRPRAMIAGGLAAVIALTGVVGLAVANGSASDAAAEAESAIADDGSVNNDTVNSDADDSSDQSAVTSDGPSAPEADDPDHESAASTGVDESEAPASSASDEEATAPTSDGDAPTEESADATADGEEPSTEEAPAEEEAGSGEAPDFGPFLGLDLLEDFTSPSELDFGFMINFVIMPDVLGMEWTEAETMLTDLGLDVNVIFKLTPVGDDDAVTEASADAGDVVHKSTTVTLWVDQVVDLDFGI